MLVYLIHNYHLMHHKAGKSLIGLLRTERRDMGQERVIQKRLKCVSATGAAQGNQLSAGSVLT